MIFILIVFAILSTFFYTITPYITGQAIDLMVIGSAGSQEIKRYLLILVFLYFMYFIFTLLLNLFSHRYAIEKTKEKRKLIIEKTMRLPFSKFDLIDRSKLSNLLSLDTNLYLDGLGIFLTQALTGLLTIVLSLILMFKTDMYLSVLVIIASPFIFYASKYLASNSRKAFEAQQSAFDEILSVTKDHLDNELIIKTYGYKNTAKDKFINKNKVLNHHSLRAQVYSAFVNPSTRFLNNILYVLIGALGSILMKKAALSVGQMVSFVSYSLMFSKPINELSSAMGQISAAQAANKRIETFLETKSEPDTGGKVAIENKDICFKNVSFSYTSKQNLIKNFNLDIKKNSKIAIVGPTGAGKSTIINLLMRFYDVSQGEILLEDVDIMSLTKENTREHISIVLQTPWVFEGSVIDNIRYSNPKASDEAVIAAAKKARADQFINQLEHGYHSIIDENLSLGEQQRISIARALLIDRPIYILDEASSNLDAVTEKEIQSVFDDIMANHTSFFVAHRLNTVVDADQIIFMSEGNIKEVGTHDELMSKKGLYYEMYQANM